MPEFMADMLKDALAVADDHLRIAREKLFEAHNALEMLRAAEGRLVIAEIIKESIPAMVDDKNQEQQLLQETGASGLTSFLIALLVMSIVLAVFWRKSVASNSLISISLEKIESFLQSAYVTLRSIPTTFRFGDSINNRFLQVGQYKINKETLKNVLQQFLNWIKSQKTNDKYVKKEIKVSIENFQSLKGRLKLMKLRKIEQNDVKDIKAAIEKVKSIEEHLKLMKSEKISEEDKKNIQTAIKTATDAVQSMEKIINEGVWLLGHV